MADYLQYGTSRREVTIASGQTDSPNLEISGMNPCKLFLPATTGTVFTFKVSDDGVTFYQLRDAAGALVTVTKAAAGDSGFYQLEPVFFAGLPAYMRVVSGSAEGSARLIAVVSQKTIAR